MSDKRIVVAIDGPAGAGKSTLAKRVAAKLGFIYINTGAMYRVVAFWALRLKVATSDMHRLERLAQEADIALTLEGRVLLNGEDVTEAIGDAMSPPPLPKFRPCQGCGARCFPCSAVWRKKAAS